MAIPVQLVSNSVTVNVQSSTPHGPPVGYTMRRVRAGGLTCGASKSWGTIGDMPLGRDFDGDGKADLIVWR